MIASFGCEVNKYFKNNLLFLGEAEDFAGAVCQGIGSYAQGGIFGSAALTFPIRATFQAVSRQVLRRSIDRPTAAQIFGVGTSLYPTMSRAPVSSLRRCLCSANRSCSLQTCIYHIVVYGAKRKIKTDVHVKFIVCSQIASS